MEIDTEEHYRQALERLNELRNAGHTADTGSEMAELEAAVAAYEARADAPGESKGKPTADPYQQS